MEEIVLYLLKSSLFLSLCYGIYYMFLKKETFFKFNRYFLLTGIFLSVILPLLNFSYTVHTVSPIFNGSSILNPAKGNNTILSSLQIGLLIYFVVAFSFILNYLLSLKKARQLVSQHDFEVVNNCKITYTDQFKTSFSIFSYIFLDTEITGSTLEQRLILEHEKAHVIQKHWLDMQIAQLMRIFQWFNPIAWLYLKAIRQNHEYLADQTVLEAGNPGAVYRATLLNHSLQNRVFNLSSSFAVDNPLSRIDMMKKRASGETKKWSVILLAPCFALIFFAFAKPSYQTLRNNVTSGQAAKVKTLPPIYMVNGIEMSSIENLDTNEIESINVFKGETAIARFGEKGKYGVIAVTLKKQL
ncbi:M56 family metallopeptidase [Pedobacter antarcticus]|uniref:M56 family metallopeptidase n=1 Tax=Pedobacter antarcticus TaxID=34086 RepID=UPI00292D24CF|nr:M56 family metallopeptidase [Pedobacter antarcticus]